MHSFFPKEIYKLPNLKFPRQMIEKRLPSLAVKIRNVSSISNKFSPDTATISLVLLLSDFSLLNIDLLSLGIRPCWLRFM